MKTLCCFLVVVLAPALGLPQVGYEIDSLKNLLKVQTLTNLELTEANARLGWLFSNKSDFDSAAYFYQKALAVPYQESKLDWLAGVHTGLGFSYSELGKNDSSISHLKEAIRLFEATHEDDNIASASARLSLVYIRLGLYQEALESALIAAKILEQNGPSFTLGSAYSTISAILLYTSSYPEALNYAKKALFAFETVQSEAAISKAYNNVGRIFMAIHQYDSARINLVRSIEIKQKLNDTKGVARTLNNLGQISMLTGNMLAAEEQFNECLALQKQMDDAIGMIELLNNLGELYLNTHQYTKSGKFLVEAENLIRVSGTPEHLRQNLELNVRLAKAQGNFNTGIIYMEQLLIIRDSLLNEEKSKSLQALQIRYETEKKEQQIALLRQGEELNEAKIRNSQILIVTLAAVGLLVYINLRNAKAAKRRIELLLAETRHRTKNNFQTLASISHLQTRYYTDREMVLEARNSESRIHTMSLLHEKFSSNEIDHTISTQAFITDLVHKLVDLYGIRSRQVQLSLHIDDIEMDIDRALALSLIIQELVCNAFKYAFDHQPNPELLIEVRSFGGKVVATISDNGHGIIEQHHEKSQGLSLVESLASQLEGTVDITSGAGTSIVITFPLTQSWKKRLFS